MAIIILAMMAVTKGNHSVQIQCTACSRGGELNLVSQTLIATSGCRRLLRLLGSVTSYSAAAKSSTLSCLESVAMAAGCEWERQVASIDIVVPCYQYARFLRDCVTSVLTQDIQNLRVLVIDDASGDNSAEIAAQLASEDPRVRGEHPSIQSRPYCHIQRGN